MLSISLAFSTFSLDSVVPDETPHHVASDQSLHCFPPEIE